MNQAFNGSAGAGTSRRRTRGTRVGSKDRAGLWLLALGLVCASILYGQESGVGSAGSTSAAQTTGSTVPRLINFSGVLKDNGGKPVTGTVTLTLSLYAEQEGGSPLWVETQSVQLDNQGHYSLLLGATQPNGLPLDLFTSGTAQWLGVQPALPGTGEQPRVLLVGMPYAMKAADADTLGGLPASAFLQAGSTASLAAGGTGQSASVQSSAQVLNQNSNAPLSLSGTGTTDFLPLWTNSTTLGNSVLFQSGTGSSAKVGLNTTTPASTLDVNGAGTVRGTLSLPATGTATASVGKNSQAASLQASAFSSSGSAAVNETFNLQAEPTSNDTSSPSGKLSLLFASGTGTPAETGLSIASNGKITFAAGQTFPGTGAGTITGVTTANGSGLTGGGTSGTLTLGLQKTCATNQVLQWNGSSWVCASVGTGTISGVTAGTDLTGGGTTGTVTLNLDTTKVPQLAASNTFTVNQSFKGNGNTALIGDMGCGSGFVGLSLFFNTGLSCTEYAVLGDSIGNLFVNRPGGGSILFRENNGTQLTIASGGGITATGNIAAASFTGDGSKLSNVGSLGGNNTFTGNNNFEGFNAFYQNTGFWGNNEEATIGNMGCAPNSVGIIFYGSPNCYNYALLDYNGSTILNRTIGQNMSFREGNGPDQMTILPGGGVEVVGTPTQTPWTSSLYVENDATSANGQNLLVLYDPNFVDGCWIDVTANQYCGSNASSVSVDNGTRQVALYAVESPENWFEDYGGGTLVNGSATVTLDPVFAQTVNTGTSYRVFVTPNGDCRGLYVTSKTATSFEVHELGGGQANIDFDYRIIAKRKGYENIRLADKSEVIKGIKEHAAKRAAASSKP